VLVRAQVKAVLLLARSPLSFFRGRFIGAGVFSTSRAALFGACVTTGSGGLGTLVRFNHADIAVELTRASSGTTTPFSCAIFLGEQHLCRTGRPWPIVTI